MAAPAYQLTVAIDSYWHPGTAQGKGAHLDAVTHRNSHGLPALPGRTLKGLLRDAVRRAEAFGWYDSNGVCDTLFGKADESDGTRSQPGLLRISDATLPEADAYHLLKGENKPLIEALYRSHFSTAIDHDTGSAKDMSLRGIELVVPLTLHAAITTTAPSDTSDWVEPLRKALPLVRAVGAYRSRGLGRATLTLEEITQ